MPWLGQEVIIADNFADESLRQSTCRLLPYYFFLQGSLHEDGYTADPSIAEFIALTPIGKELFNWLTDVEHLSDADAKIVLFTKFVHDDLLIDPLNTDVGSIHEFMSREYSTRHLQLAFTTGRMLHERHFELHGGVDRPLSIEESFALLDETLQGVFQIANLVSGSLGLLESLERRHFAPTTSVPIAHCSDPGCQRIHAAVLEDHEVPVEIGYRALIERLRPSNPASEWLEAFREMIGVNANYYSDFHAGELPWFLGNCFSREDIQNLATSTIDRRPEHIRSQLRKSPRNDLADSPSNEIAENLDLSALLQLILLVSDEDLVYLIDKLTLDGVISVPPTEIRDVLYLANVNSGTFAQRAQLSALGLRFMPHRDLSLPRLESLINTLLSDGDLDWFLMGSAGSSTPQRLSDRIHEADLVDLVVQLVFLRPEQFRKAVEYLRFGYFPEPTTLLERQKLAERILWKLGFNFNLFPDRISHFWRRFENLSSVIASVDIDTPDGQEQIRSVAVNAFVSLEEVLDETVSFCAGILLTDLFDESRQERFVYELQEYRRHFAMLFRGRILDSDGEVIELSTTGRNGLFVLIAGLREIAEFCVEMRSSTSQQYRRAEKSKPSYAGKSAALRFPFHHNVMVLDLDENAALSIISILQESSRTLDRANVMNVRNRIPHGGGRFPSSEEFVTAIRAIEQVVRTLEESGLYPLLFVPESRVQDKFGREFAVMRDYREREIRLLLPNEIYDLPEPDEPQIVVSVATIYETPDVIRLHYREASAFTDMWRDYPRLPTLESNANPM
jgi:hypothetical protein